MDTGLKKFNRLVITKVVAVILCIICVVTIAVRVCSGLETAAKMDLSGNNAFDAFQYEILGIEEDLWLSDSFRSEYSSFLLLLDDIIPHYGDGSEEVFKAIKAKEEKEVQASIDKIKENFIKAVASQQRYFVAAIISGDIELVNRLTFDENSSDQYSEYSLGQLEGALEYEYIKNETYYYDEGAIPNDIKKTFEDTDYDAIYHNHTNVSAYDYVAGVEIKYAEYTPGFYAFKVNDDVLTSHIISVSELSNYFTDYKSFYAAYSNLRHQLETQYASAKYFIRDSKGNTYTNVESLNPESDTDAIKKAFSSYGTYSYLDGETTYLNNGRVYSDTYYYILTRNTFPSYEEIPLETTTILPSAEWETTMVDNGEVTSFSVVYEDITAPAAATTSYHIQPTVVVPHTGDYECYIGIDETIDSETCRFAMIGSKIGLARRIIADCALICAVMAVLFAVCFIYLIVKAGRKQDSDEMHLLAGDRIFTEIRIIFDCGIGALALFLIYNVLAILINTTQTDLMLGLIGLLAAIVTCALLDLVLFITRHIKNKSFWSNVSIIWLIKKAFFYSKKAYSSAKKKSAGVKDKILYTKELEKTVLIRTLIAIAINIIVAGFGIIFVADDEPIGLVLVGLLFIFDLYVVYRGLKFTGGVNKLFSFVKEMRDGNLDIEINRNALPDYLMLPAENLQCLNEGLKEAVVEAIKQERTKTELITNVSHDLKTPLTSIINYVDLLKKCDISDETAVSYLNVLSEKSDRLKVLIEDLVEASKASAGAISVNFVSVSLKELINQILAEFEESFEAKNLQLVLDMPEEDIRVKADSKLIYRVLENLFVNIRKYAMENTRVYITLGEKAERGVISLKNISAAPLNISADELKERFVRGEQSRTTEGNGLGLSIAENFCTLQKGTLKIEINGDLFSVTVEMEKAKEYINV